MSGPRTPLLDEQACFRYRVIAEVQAEQLGGAGRADAVRTVAARTHVDERGRPTNVSERSLYRWLAAYQDQRLPGLVSKPRPAIDSSLVLPPPLLAFLSTERKKDRDASIPGTSAPCRTHGGDRLGPSGRSHHRLAHHAATGH